MIQAVVTRDEWTPTLQEYVQRWRDLSPTETRISRIVQRSIQQNYLTEGKHSGLPWKPRTRPYSWPMLRKTGTMYKRQLLASVGHFQKVGDTHVMDYNEVVTRTVPYAKYHFYGTQHMPARRTFALNAEEQEQIARLVGNFLLVP